MSLALIPITQREALAFIWRHHRHHKPPRGAIFCVAVATRKPSTGGSSAILNGFEIAGVATVGRPVARMLNDGWTVEVTRVCVLEGHPNACSMLYGAAWRAVRAVGYRRAVTYTLPEEGGASLRGAGWRCIGEAGGGSWHREGRPRVDMHPTQVKMRWERP